MATWFTRRRAIGALVTALVIAALGGAVALRASKKAHDESGAGAAPVTLQFATSDLTYVEARPLSRWLPVSGTL